MTKWKTLKVVLLILWAAVTFLLCYFSYNRWSSMKKNPEEFIKKIDSLDFKIDSIYIVRDSILEKIDTVYIKLEDNNKQYEKNVNNILNNDANEDYVFFLKYINSNKARLDSINNNL